MNVDIANLRLLAGGEGHRRRLPDRDARGGPADRLPAHRRPRPARQGRGRPHQPGRSGCWPRSSTTTARWSASGTTPRTTSAGSPPAPPGRCSPSGSGTPTTSGSSATSPAGSSDLITGTVSADAKVNARGVVVVSLGDVEGVIPAAEQVPGETYVHGQRLRCYVVSVAAGPARTADHPVPDPPQPGAQAVRPRGAGDRRRLASRSPRWPGRPGTDRRSRSGRPSPASTPRAPASARWAPGCEAVMSELNGEKIDIIDHDDDPATFVGNALSPANALSVTVVDAVAKAARVVVPDYQLSLAIGKEGQNARLAARLTGWRIDIRSDEGAAGSDAASDAAARMRRTTDASQSTPEGGRLAVARSSVVVSRSCPESGPSPRESPDPDLHRVSAAGRAARVASCRRRGGIRDSRPSAPAPRYGERGCIRNSDVWTPRSVDVRSAGPYGPSETLDTSMVRRHLLGTGAFGSRAGNVGDRRRPHNPCGPPRKDESRSIQREHAVKFQQ